MENTTPKKRNPPKDVRDLDRELVELRVNSLLKYLFGAQRDNSRCWIIPPGCSVPGVITSCGFTYPRLNIGGKKFLLSHLVKFIQINTGAHDANADGTDYLLYPGVEREKVDLSHLCHVKLCINPLHLVFELWKQNNQRDMCVRKQKCLKHHGGPDCMFNLLSHQVVFDQTVNLHVQGRGRRIKPKITQKQQPEKSIFNTVTPFNHTGEEYPFNQ
jgi:hypothetical protein